MSFWDEFKATAAAAYESKKSEISGYLGTAVSGIIKNAATPVEGAPNQTIQPAPVPGAAAASAGSAGMMMYALPAAIVIGALLMFRKGK